MATPGHELQAGWLLASEWEPRISNGLDCAQIADGPGRMRLPTGSTIQTLKTRLYVCMHLYKKSVRLDPPAGPPISQHAAQHRGKQRRTPQVRQRVGENFHTLAVRLVMPAQRAPAASRSNVQLRSDLANMFGYHLPSLEPFPLIGNMLAPGNGMYDAWPTARLVDGLLDRWCLLHAYSLSTHSQLAEYSLSARTSACNRC